MVWMHHDTEKEVSLSQLEKTCHVVLSSHDKSEEVQGRPYIVHDRIRHLHRIFLKDKVTGG